MVNQHSQSLQLAVQRTSQPRRNRKSKPRLQRQNKWKPRIRRTLTFSRTRPSRSKQFMQHQFDFLTNQEDTSFQYDDIPTEIFDDYDDPSSELTSEDFYNQNPSFFDEYGSLITYLFSYVDEYASPPSDDNSVQSYSSHNTLHENDVDIPTVRATFDHCTFIDDVHFSSGNFQYPSEPFNHPYPREPYETSSDKSLYSHASTRNNSSIHDDDDDRSVSKYYHHQDEHNNHQSATYSPQPSENNQSNKDFDDIDDDNDDQSFGSDGDCDNYADY